jgi:murein DD-endopeptidase MepM/ murein hydrolase activator NlpD
VKHISGILFAITALASTSAVAVDFPAAAPPASATSGGYLSAQTFPKTFDDLSFVERIQIRREGYAPFESEYNEKGVCISGCAYSGITIEENAVLMERNTAAAEARLEEYKLAHPEIAWQIESAVTPQPQTSAQTGTPRSYDFGTFGTGGTIGAAGIGARGCDPANASIPIGQRVPYGEPLTGRPRISSRFQSARVNPVDKVVRDHKGTDFAASSGTSVYSPAAGVVKSVFRDDACGIGVIVSHSDEWGTGYCHLSRATVNKGDQVGAGCKVGEVGSTGRSTGPHLHYIVYHNKEAVNPEGFLGR